MVHDEVLQAIVREAIAARSALCENELLIRLDNILELAQGALDAPPSPQPEGSKGD